MRDMHCGSMFIIGKRHCRFQEREKLSALHLFICRLFPFSSILFSLPLSLFYFLLFTQTIVYIQMPLAHGSHFAINLESDHIILHGTPEESAGVILRGSVVLNCNEATKIKSLTLKLEGKTKVNWTEGIYYHAFFTCLLDNITNVMC